MASQGPEAALAADLREFQFLSSVDVRLTNEQLVQIISALERAAAEGDAQADPEGCWCDCHSVMLPDAEGEKAEAWDEGEKAEKARRAGRDEVLAVVDRALNDWVNHGALDLVPHVTKMHVQLDPYRSAS